MAAGGVLGGQGRRKGKLVPQGRGRCQVTWWSWAGGAALVVVWAVGKELVVVVVVVVGGVLGGQGRRKGRLVPQGRGTCQVTWWSWAGGAVVVVKRVVGAVGVGFVVVAGVG